MARKKIIYDAKAHTEKKRRGRQPTAPATQFHKDKSKYNRRVKHKGDKL